MKSPTAGLLLLTAVVSFGCSTVTVKQPLGEKLSKGELKELEGGWLHPDGGVVEVHAVANGKLAFASTKWDDNEQQFKMETGQMTLTRAGSLNFVAISDNAGDRYTLALCKVEENDTVIFYAPAVDVFEKCIAEHELEGTVKQREHDKNINLEAPPDKILEFINRTGIEKCFVDTNEDKLVYRRVKKPESSGAN